MLQISNKLKTFRANTAGHVAVIFSLTIIPIIAIAGFAIDYGSATTSKSKVQLVVDSAVLSGARAMQAGKSQEQIRQVMDTYISAQMSQSASGGALTCSSPLYTFGTSSQDLSVSMNCQQKTALMNLVGTEKVNIAVSSTSTWGIGKLDVAFMFDVSGSMGGSNRMTHLKAAAREAIDTLKPADGGVATEDVRIAMVSYNDMVNAGDYFEEVTGLAKTRTYYAEDDYVEQEDVEETYIERERVCDEVTVCKKFYRNGKKKGQCKPNGWRTQTTNCRWEDVEKTRIVQVDVAKTRTVSRTLTSTCVWERYGDNAFNDAAPKQAGEPVDSIYDAEQIIYNISEDEENSDSYLSAGYAYFRDNSSTSMDWSWSTNGTSCRSYEPVGLTTDRNKLISYVNNLGTGGGTAGHQGIAWAWYLVSEKWNTVFTGDTAPLDYDEPDSVKAVILMTDGDFLHQHFGAQGSSNDQARDVCDAMKAQDKVVIYTVAFQAPRAGREILAYCASGPEFAFNPQNGQELSQAYQAIATSISDLRIKF